MVYSLSIANATYMDSADCMITLSHTKCMEGHEFEHDSVASIHLHRKVWSHNGIRVQSQLKLAVSCIACLTLILV